MKQFMSDMKWRPEGAGGKFAGPTMRIFLEKECVELGEQLKAVYPRLSKQVMEFYPLSYQEDGGAIQCQNKGKEEGDNYPSGKALEVLLLPLQLLLLEISSSRV